MVESARSFDGLIRSLYLSSAGLQDMDCFLDVASDYYHADLLGCISANAIDGSTHFPFFKGVSDSDLRLYVNRYADRNPMIAAALPQLTRGSVVQLSELFTKSQLSRMEFHTDYVLRIGAAHQCGFVFRPQSDWIHTLLVCRSQQSPDFNKQEKASIQRLRHHVESALAIESHVSELAAALATHGTAIEHLSCGVCFLSSKLEVLESNEVARQFFASGAYLTTRDGVITTGPQANAQTRRLFRNTRLRLERENAQRVDLGADADGLKFSLSLFTIDDAAELDWLSVPGTRFILFIGVQTRPNRMCRRYLRQEYALTSRELETIVGTLEGKSLAATSQDMGITHETARSHMKSVFRKLGVSSQSQVALVVSRLNMVR